MKISQNKIYYVPGIISLLILPFVFIYFLPQLPKREFAMKVYIPKNDLRKDKKISVFSQQSVLEAIKLKKKTEIYLNEDSSLTEKKFDYIFHELQRIAFTNMSTEVLIVHIEDYTKFGEIVKLLDFPAQVGLHRYAFWDNNFYYFGNEKRYPILTFICGTIYDSYNTTAPSSNSALLKKYVFQQYKNGMLWILIGFLILCTSSFIKVFSKNPQPLPPPQLAPGLNHR